MPALAQYKDFECHEWSCKRVATQFHNSYRTTNENIPALERFRRGLVCGIHAGGVKRSWNSRYGSRHDETIEPLDTTIANNPMWNQAAVEYLAERKAAHEVAIARNNEVRRQNQLEAQARFAQAWVERSTEADWDIVPGTEYRSYENHYRDGFTIIQSGDQRSSWNSTPIVVEQDGRAPAIVRVTSTGNYSPMKARAVAKALLMAADMADIRDTTNGPKGES